MKDTNKNGRSVKKILKEAYEPYIKNNRKWVHTILMFSCVIGIILLTTCSSLNTYPKSDYEDDLSQLKPSFLDSTIRLTDLNGGGIYPGDNVIVDISVINSGDIEAKNVEVKLITPDIFILSNGENRWEIDTLDIGEIANFSTSLKIVTGVTEDTPVSCSFNISSDEVESFASRECSIVILSVQHFERNYIPIIGLHAIEDNIEIPADLLTRYFNSLCSTLETFGFETITFTDILDYIDYGKTLPEKPVIITSDDGFQDVYTNAFPILKEYDYKMTVFLVTGLIGSSEADRHVNEFDIDRRIPIRPMLIWPEILEMSSYGCEFLSHTVNHIRLGVASDEEFLYELVQSKEDIETQLGKPVLFFSWPYDNYSVSKQYLLSKAGYRGAVRYGGGIEDMRTINLYNIKRVEFNGYIIPREYANYLELGGIKIDYKVDEFYKEAGEEFAVEYIIRNNIEEHIKITSLELELSDSIEFIGIEPDGYIDQEPGLSDEVYIWVSDNYIVKPEDEINLILKLKGTEASKSNIKFRASTSGVYIDCDDIEIEIKD